ncbi:hypothetical protein KAFR_0J02340 [Kazachstania africana CBS 2517]|uniref:Processing of GAS1 and ALP protein 2 n=1 Tax=Kazachstania africana (strain ATCC 22294 / BCRC 22015 / CBS 2517 / CECT 1963 / NBRC 1671 / NRRL Y-8276) TaxID=1071382 RepID=H2B0Z8_KAZAF|nr:hypothetical protein KAFR_0J02340 [Kazachstania africana CBS 2517]CCF60298.1 hypothetical protein KAFR_0J02340 [Kazachstania africana CBS 2517]
MDTILEKLKKNVFSEFDLQNGIRLVIIVGGYILFRNLATRQLSKKQLEQQVRDDERRISEERVEKLIEKPEDEQTSYEFGWGNKTRHRVQKQRDLFEQAVDRLKQNSQQNTNDSDDDIADLLED